MTQKEFISNTLEENKDAVIIGSLGTISYDLDQIEHPDKICIRGAMGCALAVGIGYAMAKPEKKVIVFIGDGAFLMKMGSLATLMYYDLKNLEVYLLNNGVHKSTGGQKTHFASVINLIPEPVIKVINVYEKV